MRSTLIAAIIAIMACCVSCSDKEHAAAPAIDNRDTLPILQSVGVSTLISDSGVIKYKIISEDWFIYDKRTPSYWAFEKGMFIEQFDDNFHVTAFITCDTAYYYDTKRLWELRGRVFVKNQKGETFRTSLLFWDQAEHEIYSDKYMEVKGETQELSGYNFRSDERMTKYIIHGSKGAFPVNKEERNVTPKPDPKKLQEFADTTKKDTTANNTNAKTGINNRNANKHKFNNAKRTTPLKAEKFKPATLK